MVAFTNENIKQQNLNEKKEALFHQRFKILVLCTI